MSKKCMPLWREAHLEAHLEIKMCYHTSVGALLDVEVSKKCMPLWREAPLEVKMYKPHQRRSTFGSCDVEKAHAVVARSTFPSQNVQSTPGSKYFWKLRCRKSARRCGAKHVSKFSKSKVQKIDGYGTLFDFQKVFFWWLAQDIEK